MNVTIGQIISIEQPDGDSYIGSVEEIHGDLVTLSNYSAWYEGDAAPYSSPYVDDSVRVRVDKKAIVVSL